MSKPEDIVHIFYHPRLPDQSEYIEITQKSNAKKTDYEKTLVIDLTGKRKVDVEALAKELKSIVSTLPNEEIKPSDAEILVISANTPKPLFLSKYINR